MPLVEDREIGPTLAAGQVAISDSRGSPFEKRHASELSLSPIFRTQAIREVLPAGFAFPSQARPNASSRSRNRLIMPSFGEITIARGDGA